MNKKKMIVIGLVSSVFMMNGCATIVSGKTQTINVTANKKQNFKVDGMEYTTPTKITVDRSSSSKTIVAQDCKDNVQLNSQLNPAFLGNVIFGGIPGSITDIASGASWKYDDSVHLDCE